MNSRNQLYVHRLNWLNIFVLAVSSFLMACEKEVTNIKILQSPPKLVIAAFISPQDTILRVSVIKSMPVLGKGSLSSDSNTDAVVILSDGVNSVTLPFNEEERRYTTDARNLPILPGQTYSLTVSSPEGLQAKASCTVPVSQNNTLEMEADSIVDEYGAKSITMQLQWKDIPGEINYYRIAAERKITYSYYRRDLETDTVLTLHEIAYWDGAEYYTDSRLDGTSFSSPRGKIISSYYIGNDPNVKRIYPSILIGYLLNTDEPYYRYHQSLQNNSNENPFAEPTPVYSNVQGGLGVFAAYNRTTVSVQLK